MFRRQPPATPVILREQHTEYVTREVHEHRAPTDASVKLLKEMESAARQKVDESIRLEGNGFECVVHVEEDPMSAQRVARAVFTLNGKRMTAEARVDADNRNPAALWGSLRDALSVVIATEVLMRAMDAMPKQYLNRT